MQTAFSTDLIAPGVPRCSPGQSGRCSTEQRETSQTAGQHHPDGGLGTEGRRGWTRRCLATRGCKATSKASTADGPMRTRSSQTS